MIYLNEIISDVYTELPPSTKPGEKVNKWCNLAKTNRNDSSRMVGK